MKKTANLLIAGLLCLMISNNSIAQSIEEMQAKIDSCKNIKDTVATARAFFKLVKHYDVTGEDKLLAQMLDSTLYYAKISGDKKVYISARSYKASYLSDIGNHEEAIATYKQIHGEYLEMGDTTRAADMLINIGMELNNTGNYSEALKEELKALDLREKIGDLSNIAAYYQHIGEVYKLLGQKDKWREYFMIADSLAGADELYANFFTHMSILNDMGGLYEHDGKYSKAREVYYQLYALCEKEQYKNGMSVALSNLVPVLKKMGLKEEALKTALQALKISSEMDKVYNVIIDLITIGELYIDLNQASASIPYLKRAESLAREKNFPSELIQSWAGLKKAFKQTGDFKQALYYFEKESNLNDSIKSIEVKNHVAELQTRYETEKKEQLIRELSLQSQLDKKTVRAMMGISIGTLIIIAFLIVTIRLHRKDLKLQKELVNKQKEINTLNQEKFNLELDKKNRELSSFALQMATKNEFINELKEKLNIGVDYNDTRSIIAQINLQVNSESDWDSFKLHFEEVHPAFFSRIKSKFPDLTSNELRLSAFLKLNLTSKEIANISNVTKEAIDKSRNRLRKKLGLLPDDSLSDFINSI